MPPVIVRDVTPEDEYYVGSCSHAPGPSEMSAYAKRRVEWMRERTGRGLRVKVALLEGKPVGFLYLSPIEISPLGPVGRDLSVVPCMFVDWDYQKKHGAGRVLVAAAEEDARAQGRKGLVIHAYYGDFWFMPAPYFEKLGYSAVARSDDKALVWKVFDRSAEPPRMFSPKYEAAPVPGKVAIDVFWMTWCGTADRDDVVRVASEFGDAVAVREHSNDDLEVLRRYEIPRGFYVNGAEVEWDHEDAERGIRNAINAALGHAQ